MQMATASEPAGGTLSPEFEDLFREHYQLIYRYRSAVNVSLDIVHARQRQVPTDNVLLIEEPQHPASDETCGVTKDQLSAALAQLSPRAVEMLILRYEHDYSDAEIAKMLGTSRGVIAVSLYRSRARLRKLLEKS